jgi:glycerophosphoryl diester phosphodiesterase
MKKIVFRLTVAMNALLAALSASGAQIIAHRGASHDAPENTLSSFKLGYQQNADADELDIYLTRDNKVVVIHDGDTGRTSGVTNRIASSTSEELRRLDVGNWGPWKGKGFTEKIPLLEEVLPLIPDGKRLFIEIKCGPEVLPELKRVLASSGKTPAQTAIIGFGYDVVKQAKAVLPNLEVCWLVTRDKKTKEYPPIEELIPKARAANLDGLDLEAGFPIEKAFVQKVHSAGLRLYTYTVDDPAVARRQAEAGVDGITTNRPGWLREQLAAAP